ncbi:methionyl-tRNA formyltransferase [Desulfogranum mediterraneum]|uniref:methionyl-tRNA formyltransferase n=1 Tax=Desulfogranum mediterraneum TaxID=160661 RepID=UPI00041508A7|nr:methionyl-tRNA formyltransferase [Desulfogranum mediterraneum]
MTAPLRILFMGTPDFACPSLQALLHGPDTVIAAICQPDRRKGRGRKLAPPPVKAQALEAGLTVLQPESVRTPEFLAQVRELAPDLIVVVAYGKILPKALLEAAPLGAINVHGSLLPRYRGAAPIQWAVLNGDRETGVTIMQLDEGMDTGDILRTATLAISPEDTAGSIFTRLAELGGPTLVETIQELKAGRITPQPQDHSQASMAPMLTKEQGHIDWSRPAEEVHATIRGLDPWPSAYGFLGGKRFRFFSPQLVAKPAAEPPGTVARADGQGLLIATGTDYLQLAEIQPEGKKRMSVQACLCGTPIQAGDLFS